MTEVRWGADAEAELIAAARWYEGRQLGLGGEFLDKVDHLVRLVDEAPSTFPFWPRYPTLHKAVVHRRFPYALFYAEVESGVFVYALAHTRRKPGYWMGRVAAMRGR